MHGVPKNLNLSRFEGATLTQICLGEFQQQFHFIDPEMQVSVEGDWRIESASGEAIDESGANDERGAYRVHRLLGRKVTGHEVDPPRSFTLRFDNGLSLVVMDSSHEYESFSINPGNIYV